MTLNPRRPGIFIFTGSPVSPQSEGFPLYRGRTHPTLGTLARIPPTNVTLPAALGRLIPHKPLFPQSFRRTNGLGFTRLGGFTSHTSLISHFRREKRGV